MNQSHNIPAEAILAEMRRLMEENPNESLPDHSAAARLAEYLDRVRDTYKPDGPTLDGHGHPIEAESMHALYLMGLPLDRIRDKLRDVVRVKPEQLARRCRKFLTLGAVYSERESFAKKQAEGIKWESWLKSVMSAADAREMMRRHKAKQQAEREAA